MTGTDSFLPPGVLKLNREYGCVVWLTDCWPIGRTGSIAKVRPDSLAIACEGFWVIALAGFFVMACVGSLAIACAGSCLTGCVGFFVIAGARFFVIAFIGLSGVLGVDFCVIT